MTIRNILNDVPLFANISTQSKIALENICLQKILKKNELLFLEGDKGYSLYILASGNIKLFKTTPEGKEVVIKVVNPGELFAEVILFEQDRYPVSATTLEKSKIYIIPKHQFYCILDDKNFRNEFIGNLMKKMRYLTDQIRYLTLYDVEDRLFKFLEDQFGKQDYIQCHLTKKMVASAIGATPETLSRLLLRLKKEKKLILEGAEIRINP